jgi:two-component sensor histidine kinase
LIVVSLDLQTLTKTRTRRWALGFGFWTCMALLYAMQLYTGHEAGAARPVEFTMALRRGCEEWYVWGLISIGILWLAGKVRIEPGRGWRWLLIHMLGAMAAEVAFVTLHAALLHGQTSILDSTVFTFGMVFQKEIHYWLFGMIIYWVILLAHQGWHFYQRFREGEQQAAALATELVEARLEMLRMQLNPHFLFNTLHTISSLIHEHPHDADRMVARVSELLRVTLDQTETQEVPLRQELAFLESYLDIERIRFQDRLSVEKQIEPGVESLLVPSLVLQPLVENAIRHGIEPREDMGRIEITARRVDGMLELKVTDNGPGLHENETAPLKEGIGLSNTRSRLSHLYGVGQHRIKLTRVPGGGLQVRLLIPCRTEARACARRVVIVPGDARNCAELPAVAVEARPGR